MAAFCRECKVLHIDKCHIRYAATQDEQIIQLQVRVSELRAENDALRNQVDLLHAAVNPANTVASVNSLPVNGHVVSKSVNRAEYMREYMRRKRAKSNGACSS